MIETQLVDYPAATVLSLQASCKHSDLGPTIGKSFGQIGRSAEGIQQAGAPRVYYVEWLPDTCTIQAAIPVESSVEPSGEVTLTQLPAGTALMASYFGPYTGLADAWSQMWKAIEEQSLKATGVCWDEYVTDPGEEPDDSKWQTDLFIAVDIPKV